MTFPIVKGKLTLLCFIAIEQIFRLNLDVIGSLPTRSAAPRVGVVQPLWNAVTYRIVSREMFYTIK